MEIRELNSQEITVALVLAWKVFSEFEAPDYPEEGVNEFRNFLDNRVEIAKLHFWGAFYNNEIVGVLAMRGNHISLFFVKKEFHRNGIGKSLFIAMLRQNKSKVITVNSSPYAQEIYCKLGFTPTDKEQLKNGIRYIPMERCSY